ncbi:hypothetical protein GF339_04040 [candidate division KSB3 bacterium]|uniref:Histidine phosphatase family protein n=1 Tax=candidate division KSB3 bacterium TaxID=2044937 RepID=A0A9D5Q4N1_9BACT|nr:hypothetical protein [candidate division KSB3 bacterium]MBD3323730.1 hypothetical protein [candidate division KSB3 bacterium]
MKNAHVVSENITRRPSQTPLRPASHPPCPHAAPSPPRRAQNRYCLVVEDQFRLDLHTGHFFLNAPGYDLNVPILTIRHGETDGNVRNSFQGQIDNPENHLNALGHEQARRTARTVYTELADLLGPQIHHPTIPEKLIVLHSPLTRTKQTADAFLTYFQAQTQISLPPIIETRLAEICFGALEGFALDEVPDQQLRALAMRYRTHEDALINWNHTGESFLDVVARAKALLQELNDRYSGQQALILAFSHGTLINALRTVVADPRLLDSNKRVAFRKHGLKNAEAYWLGPSRQLARQIFQSALPQTP